MTSLRLPRPAKPRNWCASCGTDFSSVRAFDAHRVGVHAYTRSEGLRLDPPREDGRCCLDAVEMGAAGLTVDGSGRWAVIPSPKQLAALAQLRAGSATVAQDAHGDAEGMPGRVAA